MLKAKKKGQSTLQAFDCVLMPVPPGTKRRGPRPLRGSEWALPPILLEIITTGLQRIHALGQTGNSQRCAIEANHLSHLPGLLVDFDPEVLDHYWNVERIAFMDQSSREDLAAFEPMWTALAKVLQERIEEIATGRG
jgi:hypothetical protein